MVKDLAGPEGKPPFCRPRERSGLGSPVFPASPAEGASIHWVTS